MDIFFKNHLNMG